MASLDLDCPWSSSTGESFCGSFNIHLEEDNPADILPVLEVPSSFVSSKCNIPKPPSLPSKSCIRIKYSNRPSECSSVPKETKDTWDKLFKEGYGSDVYIITEDKSYILAHSSILSVASPVLGNILQQSKVTNTMRYIKSARKKCYIEQNATLAFQAAIWRWMTPVKKNHPSAHDVFVGNWKRTKNDTLAKRVLGFGTTMNILNGDSVCDHFFVFV